MLMAAQTAGERYLDVGSGVFNRSICGPNPSSKGMARCCRVMRRMMIPGDVELSTSRGGYGSNLLIRYTLPRRFAPKLTPPQTVAS